VTTRPREFITELVATRRAGATDWWPHAFHDAEEALRRYDAGEFVHDAIGGEGPLDASFFGETCIPRAYVEDHLPVQLELTDYIDDRAATEQNIIVARRR
jgi:hypothetical protein